MEIEFCIEDISEGNSPCYFCKAKSDVHVDIYWFLPKMESIGPGNSILNATLCCVCADECWREIEANRTIYTRVNF